MSRWAKFEDDPAARALYPLGWQPPKRQNERQATCPRCGVTVTDQTPSAFYQEHDERCTGVLNEPTDQQNRSRDDG